MKKRIKLSLGLAALACCFFVTGSAFAKVKNYVPVSEGGEGRSVTDWPTGVTKYVRNKCETGYTLYASLAGDKKVKLIDMMGNVVHEWKTGFAPGMYGELLDNGNLLYSGRTKKGYGGSKFHMSGKGGVLLEMDWDGKVITKIKNPNAHHDQQKLPNGNFLQILWEPLPSKLAKQVPGGIAGTEHKGGKIFEEIISETTPEGKRIWEWRASDHIKVEECAICPLNDRLEWLHINSVDFLPADNPITKEESILLSLRHNSKVIIISKKTGDVIWEYGGCEDGEWGKLGAQHDAHIIPKGLPGAGHILIFDNGMNLPSVKASGTYWGIDHSRVIELNAKGRKVWEYSHKDKSWKFPIKKSFLFNSPYIASAQRLANGNTLVCEGATGRLLEVTKKGEIVWEYVNPDQKAIFRAYRYTPDSPALAGRTLSPAIGSDKIEDPASKTSSSSDDDDYDYDEEDDGDEEDGPTMKSY